MGNFLQHDGLSLETLKKNLPHFVVSGVRMSQSFLMDTRHLKPSFISQQVGRAIVPAGFSSCARSKPVGPMADPTVGRCAL
jgi:hypothetical protein